MAIARYRRTLRNGGTNAAMDSINGSILNDGDICEIFEIGNKYDMYSLDADSGIEENPPRIIAPDINPGSKRWHLQNAYSTAYNLDIGLQKWKATLAKLKSGTTTIYDVICLGDSITNGFFCDPSPPTNYFIKGFPGILRIKLANLFEDVGYGFVTSWFPTTDHRFATYTGTWIYFNGVTTPNICGYLIYSITAGDTISVPFNGLIFGIMVRRGSEDGQFTIQIDSGTPVTINPYQSTTEAHIYEVTGFGAGDHTAHITVDNAANPSRAVCVLGFTAKKGTSGIRVNIMGRAYSHAADASSSYALDAEINQFSPVLTICAFGTNEYWGQINPSDFKNYLQLIVTRAKIYGDCLLVALGTSSTIETLPQSIYTEAIKQIALINDCAFISINDRWVSNANANTLGFLYDGTHPNAAGHQDIGTYLLQCLDVE